MVEEIEAVILPAAHTIYETWGWLGVALLLTFENATGITPSEIILGLAGWMLIAEPEAHPSMILVGGLYASTGSAVGASIAYWVARLGGRPLVERLAHWLRISPAHISRAEAQFQRWGMALVLIGRVMPGIRTLISIPAGLAHMPFIPFFLATFVGAYIWCTLLIGAGYVLGHEWTLISLYLQKYLPYLVAGGAIALVLYFFVLRRKLA